MDAGQRGQHGIVGAGSANRLPGGALVVDAAIGPPGIEARWQLSQVVADGMCEFGPTGEVGGITTMLAMPAKPPLATFGPWQASQPALVPAWLISEPLNFAPLPTGSVATLEPAPTWQVSQAAAVGMWLVGGATMAKFAAGIA